MNDEARPNLEPIEKMVDGLGVDAVFGEPIREGASTVVPVAEVRLCLRLRVRFRARSCRGDGRQVPVTDEGSGGGSGAGRPGFCQRVPSNLCR